MNKKGAFQIVAKAPIISAGSLAYTQTPVIDTSVYYWLTTMWLGEGKSLDVINVGKKNNQVVLAKTANVSG